VAQIAGIQDFRGDGAPADIGTYQFPATVMIFKFTFSGVSYTVAMRSGVSSWVLLSQGVSGTDDVQMQAAFDYLVSLVWPGGSIYVKTGVYILTNSVIVSAIGVDMYGFQFIGEENFKSMIYGPVNAPAFIVGSLGQVAYPVFRGFRFSGSNVGANPYILFTTNGVDSGATEALVENNEFIGCNIAIQFNADVVGMNYMMVRENWLIGNTAVNGGALIDVPSASGQVHSLWIYDNWFDCQALDEHQKAISLGRVGGGPYKIDENEFFVQDNMVLHVNGGYSGTFNDNRIKLRATSTTSANSRIINLDGCNNARMIINDNLVYRTDISAQAEYFIYMDDPIYSLTVEGNDLSYANFQQADVIEQFARNTFGRYVNNAGYNPKGVSALPFRNTPDVVTANYGNAAGPTNANTDYVVDSIPCYISWSGGTAVDVTIKDAVGGNVISNPGATGDFWLEPTWAIDFGDFTVAPTVLVAFK